MRTIVAIVLAWAAAVSLQGSTNEWFAYRYKPVPNRDIFPPKVLIDPRTHIIYYLEAGNTHVAAISATGKLLWVVDPIDSINEQAPDLSLAAVAIDGIEFAREKSGSPHDPKDGFLAFSCSSGLGYIRMSDGHAFFGGRD